MPIPIPDPKPIHPNPPRWEPSPDPASINIPGLDNTASVHDQIDQIEQLITLKLQNIDANFSRMQQIMSSRLLPAFKKYAVGTQPVREAAKFWTSFYEQAAQIRIPTYEDYSSMHDPSSQISHTEDEQESEHTVSSYGHEADTTPQPHLDASTASLDPFRSESSFLPAQAISSTPAAKSRSRIERHEQNPHDTFTTQASDSSWTASLESPMVRLDRDLREFTRAEQIPGSDIMDASQGHSDDTFDETIHARNSQYTQPQEAEADTTQAPSELRTRSPSPSKGKSRAQSSLRVDVLRSGTATSPLKVRKPKTPVMASKNPYLPSGTKPRDWSGVVDLRDPNVLTPQRPSARGGKILSKKGDVPDDDEDDWDLPPGMSPPVTMDIARLPQLGRTPGKEAAARIGRDLVDAQRLFNRAPSHSVTGGSSSSDQYNAAGWDPARKVESSLSSAPTPPSLSRYTRHAYPESESGSMAADATLDSMIRRVGLMGYQQEQPAASGSRSRPGSTASASGLAPPYASDSIASTPRYTEQPFAAAALLIPATSLVTPVPPLQPRHAPTFTAYPPSPPTAPLPTSNSPSPIPEADLSVGSIDSASSTDSLDEYEEIHNTAHPSAAFLMASRQRGQNDADDSFGSSNDSADSDFDDDGAGAEGVHPFARTVEDDALSDEDESFDVPGGEEETVFGVPPAERAQRERERLSMAGGGIRMMGQELLEDTIQAQRAGLVHESPTPWASQGGERDD